MILKIQCDASGGNILIYNQDRSIFYQVVNPEQVNKMKKRYSLTPMSKIYVEAVEREKDNRDREGLTLGKRVEAQEW